MVSCNKKKVWDYTAVSTRVPLPTSRCRCIKQYNKNRYKPFLPNFSHRMSQEQNRFCFPSARRSHTLQYQHYANSCLKKKTTHVTTILSPNNNPSRKYISPSSTRKYPPSTGWQHYNSIKVKSIIHALKVVLEIVHPFCELLHFFMRKRWYRNQNRIHLCWVIANVNLSLQVMFCKCKPFSSGYVQAKFLSFLCRM